MFAMRGSWLLTLIMLAGFAGSAAVVIAHHARYLRGTRAPRFFEFLETGGWTLLALVLGVALLGFASGILLLTVAAVGAVLIVLARTLGGGGRAA